MPEARSRVLGHAQDVLPSSQQSVNDTSSIRDIQCPICTDLMQSLGQLNRHLDDEHTEVSKDVSEIGVGSWLQKQLVRGGRLPSVAAISKSLKFSEEFERNGDSAHTGLEATQQTDAIVSTKHWQLEQSNSQCSEVSCYRRAGGTFRQNLINCRQCGKLFCSMHTLFQMRLSRSATYEPKRGTWCRVCRNCYESREWYQNTSGQARDLTEIFNKTRVKQFESQDLETQRLEKRLTRLLQGIAEVPAASGLDRLDFFGAFTSRAANIRTLEQSIIPWEDETKIERCRMCERPFFLNQGKHHCRLCGRCFCGDSQTQCTALIPFNTKSEDSSRNILERMVDVRLCKSCQHSLFWRTNRQPIERQLPAYQIQYDLLQQYRKAIDFLLPRYQRLLTSLATEETQYTSGLEEARRLRKRIVDAFALFEVLSKKIANLPAASETQARLHRVLSQEAIAYLQSRVVSLQTTSEFRKRQTQSNVTENNVQNQAEQAALRDEITMFTEQRVSLVLFVL
jgi:rabenosyn-5